MSIVLNILISVVATAATLVGMYRYAPLSLFEIGTTAERKFGATITTIQGTDTLKDSRTTINTNFSNLNTFKIENSTTSVDSITALKNLVTTGTTTTGGFQGSIIGCGYGGTGTTTIGNISNALVLSRTTNCFGVLSDFGSSGQFLTSKGANTAPQWTTSSFDLTTNYNWTGQNTFHSTTTPATTTVQQIKIESGPVMINGATYVWPTATTTGDSNSNQNWASSTVPMLGVNGRLSFQSPMLGPRIGVETRDINTTGNQIITHNLGRVPQFIHIVANSIINDGTDNMLSHSDGFYSDTGSSTQQVVLNMADDLASGSGDQMVFEKAGSIILMQDSGGAVDVEASITEVTDTSFTLNWTTNANVGIARRFIWQVW